MITNTWDVYLDGVLQEGSGIATDELVKVTANDGLAGYLNDKLIEGNGILLTEINDGGNEDLQIDLTSIDTVANAELLNGADTNYIYVKENRSIYQYNSTSGAGRDGLYYLDTADAGLTRWEAVSGQYNISGVNTSGNVVIGGDLTVNGTTTTIDTTTLIVEDKNIEIGVVGTPTDVTADGGGITLKGDTDKTIVWDNANDNFTSSEHWNLPTGKSYKINNVDINTSGTLNNIAYLNQENIFTQLQTITIADTVNDIGLIINQNDVTNNPIALDINNTGTGDSLNINATDLVVKGDGNVGFGTNNAQTVIQTRKDSNTVYTAAQATAIANSLLRFQNLDDTNNAFVALNFFHRTTNTAQSSIVSIAPSGDNSEMAFVIENGGTITEAMRIDSIGQIGIGIDAPTEKVYIQDTVDDSLRLLIDNTNSGNSAQAQIIVQNDTGVSGRGFFGVGSTTHTDTSLRNRAYVFSQTGLDGLSIISNDDIRFYRDISNETMRINASGQLLIGHNTVIDWGQSNHLLQVNDNGGGAGIQIGRWSNDANAAKINFGKSRSAVIGTIGTIVQDGDGIGAIRWQVDDGVDGDSQAAEILVEVDGTPGANDTPGRIIFKTATDGSGSVTEKIRITNNGQTGILTDDPNGVLEIEDGGVAGATVPILKITADDGTPYGLVVGNDTFSTNDVEGCSLFVSNTGSCTFEAAGAGASMNLKARDYFMLETRQAGGSVEQAIYVDNQQRVKIGRTGTPTKLLELDGGTSAAQLLIGNDTDLNPRVLFKDGSNTKGAIFFDRTGTFDRGNLVFCNDGAADNNEVTIADAVMTLADSGSVGIGTTNPISAKFVVEDTATTGITEIAHFSGFSTGENNIYVGKNLTSNNTGVYGFKFNSDNSSTNYMYMMMYGESPGAGLNICDGGDIGIGTTSPEGELHIFESNSGMGTIGASADNLIIESSGNTGITIGSGNANTGNIFFGDSGSTTIGRIRYNHNTNEMNFWTNNTEQMYIDSLGGIYFPNLGGPSGAGSNARYSTTTDELYYETSSLRYKENIVDTDNSKWLYNLKLKNYDRIGQNFNEDGFVAEEVEELTKGAGIQGVVFYNKKGQVEGYNKSDLVPYVINELQNHEKIIGEYIPKTTDEAFDDLMSEDIVNNSIMDELAMLRKVCQEQQKTIQAITETLEQQGLEIKPKKSLWNKLKNMFTFGGDK